MKQISMKKGIEILGGTDIELHACYHYQMGFFNWNGQLYYINSGDDRLRRSDGQLDVMFRTAQHRKDWIGGRNDFSFVQRLNEKGYKVMTCRVQK